MDVGNILIDGLSERYSVLDIEITGRVNEHAICEVKLRANEKTANVLSSFQNISINELESNQILFLGKLESVKTNHHLEVVMRLISNSVLFDLKKKKATFQDISLTYAQIADYVSKREGENIQLGKELDVPTKHVLYQYEETSWEFLKRIASMAGTYVIPTYKNPQYSMLIGTIGAEKDVPNELLEVHEQKEYQKDIVCLKTYKNLSIGEKILYNSRSFIVQSEKAVVDKGILLFEYALVSSDCFRAEYINNLDMCGLVLSGKACNIKENGIMIQFDIDQEQNSIAAYEYPWKTITGNLLYCMPEEGSKVLVNMNDDEGTEARAISCLKSNEPCYPVEMKTFVTPFNKKMHLDSENLLFSATGKSGEKNLTLLKDEDKVLVDSSGNIIINSCLGNIQLKSKVTSAASFKDINVKCTRDCVPAELVVSATIEINGNTVTVAGKERIGYLPFEDAPTEIVIDAKKWGKLALKVLFTVAVVALACVVAVALAPVAAALAGAATCTAVATASTASVVGGVIATCAIGGTAYAAATCYSQYKKDKENGIKRSPLDYLYMGIDNFCTGAIMTAPMAAIPIVNEVPGLYKFIGFGARMSASGLASLAYQWVDSTLDEIFGGDFYDADSDVGLNLICDLLCNAFGEFIGYGLDAAFSAAGNIYKAHLKPYLNITGRTAARQHLKSTMGVDAMKYWRELLYDVYRQNKVFAQNVDKLEKFFSAIPSALENYGFTFIDKNTTEYKEVEQRQYFEFDGDELVWQ